MSTITGTMSNEKGISAFIRSHPLVSYFFLAYAWMWLFVAPLVMDAFGLMQLSDLMSLVLFVLSSWSGPTVAAYWVTGVLEGKAGIKRLFRRTFQFRAGLQWYAVALFAFPSIWIAAYSFLYEGAPFATLAANPYLLISTFLPSVLMGMLITSIGEELAWRGFALPRLQFRYNTLTSSLIVGTFWTLFYLPLFFTLTGSSQANMSF